MVFAHTPHAGQFVPLSAQLSLCSPETFEIDKS